MVGAAVVALGLGLELGRAPGAAPARERGLVVAGAVLLAAGAGVAPLVLAPGVAPAPLRGLVVVVVVLAAGAGVGRLVIGFLTALLCPSSS